MVAPFYVVIGKKIASTFKLTFFMFISLLGANCYAEARI